MGMEKAVLNRVSEVLKKDRQASFTCGTLFVECTVSEAAEIEMALLDIVNCKIQHNRVGDESAFDFV